MKKYTVNEYIGNHFQIEAEILEQTEGLAADYFRDEEKKPYIFYERDQAQELRMICNRWKNGQLQPRYRFVPNYSSLEFDVSKRIYMKVEEGDIPGEISSVSFLIEDNKILKGAYVFYIHEDRIYKKQDWSTEVAQLLGVTSLEVVCRGFETQMELLRYSGVALQAYSNALCLTEYAFPCVWDMLQNVEILKQLNLQLVDVYNFLDRDFAAKQANLDQWKMQPFTPLLRFYAALPPVFSYHTFVLPVTIDNLKLEHLKPDGWKVWKSEDDQESKKELFQNLQSLYQDGHGYTIDEKTELKEKLLQSSPEDAIGYISLIDDEESNLQFNRYNLYRFFYNSMLDCLEDAIYYKYNNKKRYLEIECYPTQQAKGRGDRIYLEVNDIAFRLHDCINQTSWAGFLIISVSNRFYADILSIEKINQMGRRIYPPYINPKVSIMESAREIRFTDIPFQVDRHTVISKEELLGHRLMKATAELLESLFGKNSNGVEIIERWEDRDCSGRKLVVDDIADDRMFVVTHYAINDNEQVFRTYSTMDDHFEVNKLLYQFCCIDNGSSSCQSPRRIIPLLEEKLYEQWIEENTVYGITQHSMLMFTTPEVPNYLYVYFYTLYFEMILFTLLQRVFIIHYIAAAGRLSESFNSREILILQRNYVRLKNRYLLPEVTPQAHPIELYAIMQERLGVTKQQEVLEEQISILFETSNNIRSDQLNVILFCFTLFSLISIYADFSGLLKGIGYSHFYLLPTIFIVVFLLVLVGYVFRTRFGRWLKAKLRRR